MRKTKILFLGSVLAAITVFCAVLSYASMTSIALDRMHSLYNASKFNYTGAPLSANSATNHIQYRMNCYGYAFRYLHDGYVTLNGYGEGYKQQPGDFKLQSAAYFIMNTSDPAVLMSAVIGNLSLDAARLGFTITEYTPKSSVIPQYGGNSRMVAVVTGFFYVLTDDGYEPRTDYHFYMQHSDGTWSHKPGSGGVSNVSLSNGVPLTNSNIIASANEGLYSIGARKFLIISRDAVIEHLHGDRDAYHYTSLISSDEAGDSLESAALLSLPSCIGAFDFGMDEDCYYFTIPTTKSYNFAVTTENYYSSLNVALFDSDGNIISGGTGSQAIYFTTTLTAGQTYFLGVADANHQQWNYYISID